MSSGKKREGDKTSSSENTSPLKQSATSFKRRSTNNSQNVKSRDRDDLKFVRVGKPSEDLETHFRKTKTSIGDPKSEARSALVDTSKTKTKLSNNDRLLDSIIQSRCLTKDQDRDSLSKPKTFKETENDYYDPNPTKDSPKLPRKDSNLRKSVTSNQERNEERPKSKELVLEKREQKVEEDIDKPWISYLRNLRIPMM